MNNISNKVQKGRRRRQIYDWRYWKEIQLADRKFALWILFRLFVDAVKSARKKELRKYGITTRQMSLMAIISNLKGAATPAEIARSAVRKPHAISQLLSKMQSDGLISKSRDPVRSNRVRISLTTKGNNIYTLANKREAIERVLSTLTEQEYEQAVAILQKLLDNLTQELNIKLGSAVR